MKNKTIEKVLFGFDDITGAPDAQVGKQCPEKSRHTFFKFKIQVQKSIIVFTL